MGYENTVLYHEPGGSVMGHAVMPKVGLGDETNLGESGRSSAAASTAP